MLSIKQLHQSFRDEASRLHMNVFDYKFVLAIEEKLI